MKRKPARKPAKRKQTAKFHGIPVDISGLHQVPAFADSSAADQRKMLGVVFSIVDVVARLERQARILEERRDNGQSLAEEGRAARKPRTDRHAAQVCRIYKLVRPSFPPGRAGNGAALAEVSRRADPSPGYEKPMTKQGIRKLLKRCGVPCR